MLIGMFAELLRKARAALGIKQEEIAERLADLGHPVGQTTVSAWECGPTVPRDNDRLGAIAAAYELDPEVVMRAAFGPRRKPAADPSNADLAADIARLQGVMEEILTALRAGATPGAAPPSTG
jgi:transcriptional regulator with XRE-family HTH domain